MITALSELSKQMEALRRANAQIESENRHLRKQTALLQSILDALPGNLKAVDHDLHILASNAGAMKGISTSSPEQIQTLCCHDLFMNLPTLCENCSIRDVLETGQPQVITTTPDDPREQRAGHPLQISLVPLRDETGAVIGAMEYDLDVSRLQQAIERADAATQAKGEFMANLSQEIRTPLNTIFGLSHQLIESCTDETRSHILRKINSSSRLLLDILNRVRDYSKIETGKLRLDSHDFQITHLLDQMEDMFVSAAQDKGLDIAFRTAPDVPPVLSGDSLRLSQVLGNLLANAIKFTEYGRVELLISRIDDGDEHQAQIRFEVRDTGIGMNDDQIQNLLHAVPQTEILTSPKGGGTVLGLSISQKLVECMGGTLHVHSTVGKGSSFHFELNLPVVSTSSLSSLQTQRSLPSADSSHNQIAPTFTGSSILLVEDNLMNQEIATWWLERAGTTATIATNGIEAIKMAQSIFFDLILMDLQMPEMDGFEATRQIRAFLPNIPIVALSAASMDHDRQMSRQVGMNDYLTKPIEGFELYRVLGKWLKSSDTHSAAPTPSVPSVVLPTFLAGFDLPRGLRLADGNAFFYLQTLHRFYEQLQGEFSTLLDTLKQADFKTAAHLAHTLKGIASTVGAQPLADAATDIDRSLKLGNPIDEAQQNALEQALRSALTHLKTLPPLPLSAHKADSLLGEQSLPTLLHILRSQDLVDEALLSNVEAFLLIRHGNDFASQLRKFVETFNYSGAISLLSHLAPNQEKHPPHE